MYCWGIITLEDFGEGFEREVEETGIERINKENNKTFDIFVDKVIPLPKSHHLIQFIEDITKCKLTWEFNFKLGYGYILFHLSKNKFKIEGLNLLQSLFQLACKIVEEE